MATKKGKGPRTSQIVVAEAQRGNGKFYYVNGATYDGDWALEVKEPEVAPPSKSHDAPPPVGEKQKRCKDGKGIFIDGDYSYEGGWEKDLASGEGVSRFASGAKYEGQFKMGQYNGSGTYTWPDGRSYTGDWRDNKMHGNGTYIDKEGRKWIGQFFNGSGPGLTCEL